MFSLLCVLTRHFATAVNVSPTVTWGFDHFSIIIIVNFTLCYVTRHKKWIEYNTLFQDKKQSHTRYSVIFILGTFVRKCARLEVSQMFKSLPSSWLYPPKPPPAHTTIDPAWQVTQRPHFRANHNIEPWDRTSVRCYFRDILCERCRVSKQDFDLKYLS